MSDAITLIRHPTQTLKEFNEELRARCGEMPITDFHLVVVDGQPVVTLISEEVEADVGDVEQAKKDDPDNTLAEGDPIPASDPLLVQVSPVEARTSKDATNSRSRLDKLYERTQGAFERVVTAIGETNEWVPNLALAKTRPDGSLDPDKDGNPRTPEGAPVPCMLVRRQVVYMAVASLADEPAVDEAQADA